ncbi:MAG: NAD(P)-binding protein [Candidatus Nanopelagicales bacterium]
MQSVAVIGSGISGIAAAHTLIENNYDVTIFDQGKNPGGRLGLRTLRNHPYANRVIDVGAAYFTVSDPIFKNKLDEWTKNNLVHEWTDTFHVFNDFEITTTTGPMRYAAKKGLRSLAFYELDVLKQKGVKVFQEKKVEKVKIENNKIKVDEQYFDFAVLAMPGLQAARILEEEVSKELAKQTWDSALSAWLVIDGEIPKYDAMFVNNHEVISLIVNDGKRRKDNAPIINAITTSNYAKERLENYQDFVDEVVDHVLELWNIKSEVVEKGIARWSIAQPKNCKRVTMPKNMALVGDAYDFNPRIESAWLDGVAVLKQLIGVD